MTILDLLEGKKVNLLHVNVLKQINSTQYIVGDKTGLAILTVLTSENSNNVEVGKGLKMVKPSVVDPKNITSHPKFTPTKTKPIEMTVNEAEVLKLENSTEGNMKVDKGISFNSIESDYGENALIENVLVYVQTKSRKIDGAYGPYQICNIVDYESNKFSINLYKNNVDKLEVDQVYMLQKIKKTSIRTETGIRMATTNFTRIKKASPDQSGVFKDVKLADEKITGTCLMFSDLSYYASCKKHLTKLSENKCCPECGEVDENEIKMDLRCKMIVEDENDDEQMVSITVFMKHLEKNLDTDFTNVDDEDVVAGILDDKVTGKVCEVHFNKAGTDNNVAVKVKVT